MNKLTMGMLWFDNDKKTTLDEKVDRAANYYQEKYGKPPTLCHLSPDELGKRRRASGIQLVSDHNIMKGHLLIGVP